MIWVAWRLHRVQLIIILAIALISCTVLLLLRANMASYIEAHQLADCMTQAVRSASCAPKTNAFQVEYNDLTKYTQAAAFTLPVIFGLFCGGPLFAREIEQGTHVFALTQSVSRTRWFAVKAAMTVLPAMAAAGAITVALWSVLSVQGYVGVLGQGLFHNWNFDTTGLAPAAYTLFAVGVGIALGIITRSTLAAMAGTLVAFVTARVIGDLARGHWQGLLPTQRIVRPLADDGIAPDQYPVAYGFLTKDGRVIPSDDGALAACVEQSRAGGDPTTCYPKLGITQQFSDVLGPTQYWTAQLIELVLFGGAAAALLGVSVWLLRKRSL